MNKGLTARHGTSHVRSSRIAALLCLIGCAGLGQAFAAVDANPAVPPDNGAASFVELCSILGRSVDPPAVSRAIALSSPDSAFSLTTCVKVGASLGVPLELGSLPVEDLRTQ